VHQERFSASSCGAGDRGENGDLGALRDHIDSIDVRIVELLAERKMVVETVAGLKRARNLPLYHPAREEDLISRRREQAAASGLDPDMVEDVFRRVLRASRLSQSATLAGHAVRANHRVLVVGGRGSMGRSLCRWFEAAGYEVRVLEREDWPQAAELCAGADLALLSVPIAVTTEVAHRLGPHLPAKCVLADITSVKVRPLAAMLAAHAGPVVGLHPMFGPTTTTMDKQIVVATAGRDDEACEWVLDQLAAWGAVVVRAGAQEHDEAMAVVQALRHFATFAFGQFLCRANVDLARTLEFSGPIYRLELGMVGRLFAQAPELYAEIIFATPERLELLRSYVRSLTENLRLLEAGDREAFCREFEKVAQWFGPFSDQAIRESSYLIEKLVERF
jgi:chorismate mutase/prephenate dehydrogenase